jgi:hypothetical protein
MARVLCRFRKPQTWALLAAIGKSRAAGIPIVYVNGVTVLEDACATQRRADSLGALISQSLRNRTRRVPDRVRPERRAAHSLVSTSFSPTAPFEDSTAAIRPERDAR